MDAERATMRILYIHQYFVTPSESAATRSYWFARELVQRGHDVTVLTTDFRDAAAPARAVRMVDGIRVVYFRGAYDNNMGIAKRLEAFARFMASGTWEALRARGIDLVYATSTPLTVGFPALVMRALRGVPYVFEVRDLWPEFPVQMGAVQNPALIGALRLFERHIYRRAAHIVALSPGMVAGVESAGVSPEKVTLIPNMSKPDQFFPREGEADVAARFDMKEPRFRAVHFGSMGRANGLGYLIDAARVLHQRGESDIEVVFVGAGATENRLKKSVAEHGLSNVRFLGYHATEDTSSIVNLCDASIVSFMNLPILATNSPNKLFDSLAAGKPVIVNSPGWTRDLVEQEECGVYVDARQPEQLADALCSLRDDQGLRERLGARARELALQRFDRKDLASELADLLERSLSAQRGR